MSNFLGSAPVSKEGAKGSSYDPFADLKTWTQYAGGWPPTVIIQVVPKVGQTAGSILGNLLGSAAAGAVGSSYRAHYSYEFKDDLDTCDLIVGDEIIQDLQRGMIWQPMDFFESGVFSSSSGKDLARAGIFWFSPGVFLPDTDGWPKVELVIKSAKNEKRNIRFALPRVCLERIAIDFEPYYWAKQAQNLPLRVGLEDSVQSTKEGAPK